MTDDAPLNRLRAAQAASWPNLTAALDDIELTIGSRPSSASPEGRLRALWDATITDCGLQGAEHEIVVSAVAAIAEMLSIDLDADSSPAVQREILREEAAELLDLANAIPDDPANPQGLAGFDPMEHPRYRTVARAFLDGYLRKNGMEPATLPKDELAARMPQANPQGLDVDFDPTESPAYRELLQRQSDERRDSDGRLRIDLFPEHGRPLYPVANGPGSGRSVEVTVRVMVGTKRSTVIVAHHERDLALYEIREHGAEVDGVGVVVEAALRDALERLRESRPETSTDPEGGR